MADFKKLESEEALDALADILEPLSEIMTDEEIRKAYEKKEPLISIAVRAIKSHTKEIIFILATLEGVPVEEYKCNILTLPMKLLQLLNDKEIKDFFTGQVQKN